MPAPMENAPTGGPPPPSVPATSTPASAAAPDLLLRYPYLNIFQLLQRLHLLTVVHPKGTKITYYLFMFLVAAVHATAAAASFILGSTTTPIKVNVTIGFSQKMLPVWPYFEKCSPAVPSGPNHGENVK